jgi:hypothetical protein
MIAAYATGQDSTPVATATSDAQGAFSLNINSTSFDGYVKATKSGFSDTYAYPAGPFDANGTLDANMISSSLIGLLITIGGGDASKGVIISSVVDSSGAAVTGAKVSSTPGCLYKYTDASGTPTSTTATNTDGVGFFFSVPSGSITVSASKAGATFKSHAVTARPNTFTTAVISE